MSCLKKMAASGLGSRRWLAGLTAGLLGGASVLTAAATFEPEGSEYAPAGSVAGDQLSPALAVRASGGWLVWQDNNTDGDGFGISARRLTAQLTGLSSMRINEVGAGDQENPQVVQLADGGGLIVWQSGNRGAQKIVGRILKPDGKFAGGEFEISDHGTDNREAAAALGADGNVLVVWGAEGVDGSMQAVQAQRISPAGQKLGVSFVVNQATQYHQRSPSVAGLVSGGYAVAWISEQQRLVKDVVVTVDVYARFLKADGTPSGDEALINSSANPCATPNVVALPTGGVLIAWSEHDFIVPGAVWDVYCRTVDQGGAKGTAARVNTRQDGFQGMPKLAVAGDSVLAVYRSEGGDGVGFGVVGQWLGIDGKLQGGEIVFNSRTAGDQLTPTIASDGSSRVLAVWSTFAGSAKGMDLAAQRYTLAQSPLAAPAPPFVFAASPSKLLVTWPALTGLALKNYVVYLDGSEVPNAVNEAYFAMSGLSPSSSHSVRVAYILSDGRQSPLSAPTSGQTWGEDDNADGLPDDWQEHYFGASPAAWPVPSADSDGDGVSNRDEFLAGTDPTSKESVLRMTLQNTPQGGILVWNCRAGALYQVQYSLDLREWTNVGAARFAAGETDSLHVGEVPGNAYYRVNFLR